MLWVPLSVASSNHIIVDASIMDTGTARFYGELMKFKTNTLTHNVRMSIENFLMEV